jgi:hypothetical protein
MQSESQTMLPFLCSDSRYDSQPRERTAREMGTLAQEKAAIACLARAVALLG